MGCLSASGLFDICDIRTGVVVAEWLRSGVWLFHVAMIWH